MLAKIRTQLQKTLSPHIHILIILLLSLIVGGIYVALRVIPITHESVAYTYDQGRDFATARDIVRDKNLVLIGPTTGMQGIFHGVWWYYYLAVAYALFSGAPQGFYAFMVATGLIQTGLLVWFIRKEVSPWLALFIFSLIASAPYFIYTSTFASNTILVLPSLMLLLLGVYQSFKKSTVLSALLIGSGLGMILESEVAFGILIMPAIVATYVLVQRKNMFPLKWKNGLGLIAGYALAVLPRILFELKYNFMQSRVLFNFSERRVEINPSMKEILLDRIGHFHSYFGSLIQHEIWPFVWVLFVCVIVGYWKGFRKLHIHQQKFVQFVTYLVVALFGISLFYTKNPFYGYYYEGLTFFFLILVVYGLHALSKVNERMTLIVTSILMVVISIHALMIGYKDFVRKPTPEGLHMHTIAISHVLDKVGKNKFCLRMYTPPAITYTYNYLLDYEVGRRGATYPYDRFINKTCWYFIESDALAQRRLDWMKNNIPAGSKKIYEYKVSPNLLIQQWQFDGKTAQPDDL